MLTVLLLIASNIFMTFAWYGHLKYPQSSMLAAIAASWGIAFFEYCLQVPANRLGSTSGFTTYQLKITQEVITLVVFVVFAWLYLKETPKWNHLVAFALIVGAVFFAKMPVDGADAQKPDRPQTPSAPLGPPPSADSELQRPPRAA
ncbi:MAG: DMT family protein [Planctomycetota bacterium]|nr:DMT family protein [Planctomycetota bacterium]